MSRLYLLTVLSTGLVLASFAAEDKTPQTIKGWGTVVDPDGDCRVIEENGKLTIRVPGTYHDLTHSEGRDKLNSPRILQEVKGDFVVQVKANAFPLFADNTSTSLGICFVSSGLLIWQDEKNFIRLDRAAENRAQDFSSARHRLRRRSLGDALQRTKRIRGYRKLWALVPGMTLNELASYQDDKYDRGNRNIC